MRRGRAIGLIRRRIRGSMSMGLRSELETLSARELIQSLSVRIYESPIVDVREQLLATPSVLRIVILVLGFDTEVCMQGMLGFLENSTGLYFAETIEAFERIGATETVATLQRIEAILQKHGITPSGLRSDFADATLHEITTFRQLHGEFGTFSNEIEEEANRLYLCAPDEASENVWQLLAQYVEQDRAAILDEISSIET